MARFVVMIVSLFWASAFLWLAEWQRRNAASPTGLAACVAYSLLYFWFAWSVLRE